MGGLQREFHGLHYAHGRDRAQACTEGAVAMRKILLAFLFLAFTATAWATALVQQDVESASSKASEISFSLASNTTSGNVLLAVVSYSYYGEARTVTPPDGNWTEVFNQAHNNAALTAFWRVAPSAVGNYTFDVSGSNEWVCGFLQEFSGVNTTTPIYANVTGTGASDSAVIDIGNVTGIDGASAVAYVATDTGRSGALSLDSVSSGWTEAQTAEADYHQGYWAYKNSTLVGAEEVTCVFTFNGNTGSSVGVIMVLLNATSAPNETYYSGRGIGRGILRGVCR